MPIGNGGFDLYNSMLGPDRDAEVSQDGKCIRIRGEIADGIPGSINIRPSKSKGSAMDFELDGGTMKHIEND